MGTSRSFGVVLAMTAALSAYPGTASAQQNQSLVISLPLASQRAVVGQRIGLTDFTVVYHRPLLRGRKLDAALLPPGDVWRAGANENTTIEVSDAVTVEGKPLPKGIYGLHMIPGPQQWTIIFSKSARAWGSFTYDEKEDQLRVPVTVASGDPHEALTYTFSEVGRDATTLTLQWGTISVPMHFAVDVKAITLASLKDQLRGLVGYTWIPWNDAATYCLENKVDLEQGLKWADQSIQVEERFENLDTKAQILTALGRTAEGEKVITEALPKATPLQRHYYARRLITEKKPQDAMKIFKSNAEKHPDVWFTHVGMARGYAALGDYKAAAGEMKTALTSAPPNQKSVLEGQLRQLERGEDINR